MKKCIWILMTSVLSITMLSCGPSHIVRIHPTPDHTPISIIQYQMPNDDAEEMINCFRSRFVALRKKPEMFTTIPRVQEQIYASYPSDPNTVIDTIYARYKGDIGKSFYCKNVCGSKADGACDVDYYTTILTRVTITTMVDKKLVPQTMYFNYTQLCPPPKTSCKK